MRLSRCTTTSSRDSRLPSSRTMFDAASGFCRRPEAIVGSPTSISERLEPRSAERSAGKRKQGEGEKPGRTPGKPICAVRPIPSTGVRNYLWLKALSLDRERGTIMDQARELDDLMETMVATYVARNRAAGVLKAMLDETGVGFSPVIDHVT